MTSPQTKEKEAFLNTTKTETLLSGKEYKVFAVPWVHGERFARAAAPLFNIFSEGESKGAAITDTLRTMVEQHGNNLLELAECCTSLTREELNWLQLDDMLMVCGSVLTVNLSFFTQRLQGRLPVLLAKLLGGLEDSGSKPPSDSSPTVTDLKT